MKIVLLPGLDGTGFLFKPLIEVLSNDFDVLVVSYPVDLKLSYNELVEFVINQLADEKFILLAESFSGPIAYQLALRMADKIESIIFVATFIGNPRKFILLSSHFLPGRLLFSLPIPDVIIKSFLLGFNINKQMIDLFKQSIKQVQPDVLAFRLKEISKLSLNYGTSDISVTYIQASNDKLVPNSCLEEFKKVFSNINVFKVDGPHFILQAAPVLCADIIIKSAFQP